MEKGNEGVSIGTPKIMKVILEEKKEPNPQKYFRLWERGNSLDIGYSQEEYKVILGKLLRKEVILANEVTIKAPITLTKRRKNGRDRISIKIPDSALTGRIQGGIQEKYQMSTTSASHHQYIVTLYSMCMKETGYDSAEAWPLQ